MEKFLNLCWRLSASGSSAFLAAERGEVPENSLAIEFAQIPRFILNAFKHFPKSKKKAQLLERVINHRTRVNAVLGNNHPRPLTPGRMHERVSSLPQVQEASTSNPP